MQVDGSFCVDVLQQTVREIECGYALASRRLSSPRVRLDLLGSHYQRSHCLSDSCRDL